ncbi:MAG: hypothetical protein M3Q57_01975 [Pseudomonadota bacterium]|nr:hypothetical protein [Pseudomonadota bacterium]
MARQHYFGAPAHLRQSQAPCDSVPSPDRQPSIRREAPPLPPALVPSDDELKLRLAEELEYARRLLDTMGDELAADMAVIMRHSVALQSVDIVGQMLGHIANVVRSSDPPGAVERIGMCELKARLQRHRL